MLLSSFLSLLTILHQEEKALSNNTSVTSHERHLSNTVKPVTILVEGNVGSGKSSFLDILSSEPGVEVYQEPVEAWRDVEGDNLFQKMITQPQRWSTSFQLYSSLTRTRQALEAARSSAPIVILERSLYSERYCFVETLRESGFLQDGELALLDRYFQRMTDKKWTGLEVDLIVYIRSDPSILQERIRRRGRQEEEGSIDQSEQSI